MPIEVGAEAPRFELRSQHGETVELSTFAGAKNVMLVFYPFAFSSVCTAELDELRDRYAELAGDDTEILAVSCDHRYALRAYADRDGYPFSLLSDYWPHGAVARSYGVFDEQVGCSRRSTFLIDRRGRVRWSVHHEIGEARDVDAYLAELGSLRAEHDRRS